MGNLFVALDPEAQHPTTHTVAVLLDGNCTLMVRVQSWVIDRSDMGRCFEGFCDGGRVLRCLMRAQVEGFETTVGEPAVERRGDSTNRILEEC